jgi:hypothetical protein
MTFTIFVVTIYDILLYIFIDDFVMVDIDFEIFEVWMVLKIRKRKILLCINF